MYSKTYPPPPDLGDPPDAVAQWAKHVVDSWNLTPKERTVCDLILKGLHTEEIASVLGNGDKTVKHHIAVIFKKAGVGSRAELFSEILRL